MSSAWPTEAIRSFLVEIKQSVANPQPIYVMSSSDSSAGLTRLMKAESDAQKIIEDARNSTSFKSGVCFSFDSTPPRSPLLLLTSSLDSHVLT